MATPTKTIQTAPIALQSVASGAVVLSSAIDVSSKFAGQVFIHFGRRATTALTLPTTFRVEASATASGDGHWYPIAVVSTEVAAAESEAVSGTVSSGTKVITVASTTNLAAGDSIYIDNGTIANSEWARIKSIVSNTSVTIEDNLVNAQTGATIYDQAQIIPILVDLSTVSRIRIVVDNSVAGQAVAVEVELTTLDSIG